MEGFQVITSDDCNLGSVVGVEGDNLIIEHGTLRKTRHAVPTTFAHADEGEKTVRLSVSKEIVDASPKVNDDGIDTDAIARHYGLAEAFEEPETEGYGDVLPDDPAFGAEQDAFRAGQEPGPAQTARIRDDMGHHDQQQVGSSPGLLGDRLER
jgi:hypothetical protein